MTNKNIPTTPEGKFAEQVKRLVLDILRRQRFVIPTLSADPPTTDPTNLWMRWDGRLRGRYWNGSGYTYVDYPMRSDITSPPAVPAYPSPPASAATPQTYVTTWPGTWSQSYQGSNAKRTDTIGEQNLVFGTEGSFGLQKSLVGFDYTSIVSALTGSTIQEVKLTMTMLHTYWPDSVSPMFGMHNLTSEPTTYDSPGSTILRYGFTDTWSRGETKTVNLPMAFAQQLRAGTAKGLVLEAPNSDPGFFGYAAGVGSGYTPPQLTITYAK